MPNFKVCRILLFCLSSVILFSQVNGQSHNKLLTFDVSKPPLPPAIQSEIDSLKLLLKGMPPGADKFKLYGKICWAYAGTRVHLDAAKQYADSIRIQAEQINDKDGIAYSKFYYGYIDRHAGNYSTGLNHLQQFVQHNVKIGDSIKVANGLYQIGVIHSEMGNYDKSLSAYYRILAIWQQKGKHYQIGFTLNSIAVIFKKMKRYNDAIEKYHEALAIFDSLNVEDKGYVKTNIANVYAEMNEFEKASQYYKQAVAINTEYGNEVEVAASLQSIGTMFNKMQRHDSALAYHLKAFLIHERTPQKFEIATCQRLIGYSHFKLGNYNAANSYFKKALVLASEIGAKPLMRDIYENLSALAAQQKNFGAAYSYHLSFAALNDSVLNETTTQQLNELQTKYETGEKDKQITLLAKEKEIQAKEAERQGTLKKAFIGGLILVSLLTILLIYIFRQRLKNQRVLAQKNNEIRDINFKRLLTELEMKALRAQINPHFLFNCMNSINRMILNGDTENASLYLTKFSKLVRLILENAESTTVSLDNELALLESYIQLEELRFKGKIDYKISVDESIEPESTYLPSMVLQPFVENAIWHGLMHKGEYAKGIISIAVKEKNNRLLCTIEDNGVGREKAKQLREQSILKSRSMGMKITEDRLKLLNQDGDEPGISVTDLKDTMDHPAGTRVEINIPMS